MPDETGASQRQRIAVDLIETGDTQPRRRFDGIAALAKSLAQDGQVVDLLVRPMPPPSNSYELIGGERRLRAARAAGLSHVWARVLDCDDAAAHRLALVDNLHRRSLRAIEKIEACRRMLDVGVFATQQELADTLGVSKSALSNQLAILTLPPPWPKWFSRENYDLRPSHGRCLQSLRERPAVLSAVAAAVQSQSTAGSKRDFERLVESVVRQSTRPIDDVEFLPDWDRTVQPLVDPADERLDVETLPSLGRRAFNVDRWDKLQTAAEADRDDEPPEQYDADDDVGASSPAIRLPDGSQAPLEFSGGLWFASLLRHCNVRPGRGRHAPKRRAGVDTIPGLYSHGLLAMFLEDEGFSLREIADMLNLDFSYCNKLIDKTRGILAEHVSRAA